MDPLKMRWSHHVSVFGRISQSFLEASCVTEPYLPFAHYRLHRDAARISTAGVNILGAKAARSPLRFWLIAVLFHLVKFLTPQSVF
jgi:hypothetical protein